jgi:hypothetical protein
MKASTIFTFTCLITLVMVTPAKAQDNIEEFLEAGPDASALYQAYFEPMIIGFGYGAANSWYTSAKTHETFGIDLSITATAVYAPDDQLTYNTADLNLENNPAGRISPGTYPTSLGPTSPIPRFTGTGIIGSINGPVGFDFANEVSIVENATFVPMIQLGIGTVKNTDVKIRFASDFGSISDVSFLMWGIGIQHDINQWIPFLRRAPVDLAVLLGYSNFSSDVEDFSSSPEDVNEKVELDASNFTAQLLVSKQISFFTAYAGIGYAGHSNEINVLGTYQTSAYGSITDPATGLDFNASSFRATFGGRLKFGFFSIFSDYTFQEYNAWSVGIGLVNLKENDRLGL